MKKNEPYKDEGLRRALQRKNDAAERMTLPEDFTDRLMQRIEQRDERPRRRRLWLYPVVGAVAASILLLLAFHFKNHAVDKEDTNVIAQKAESQSPRTEQREPSNSLEWPSREGRRSDQQTGQRTEQQDNPVDAPKAEYVPMRAQDRPVAVKTVAVNQLPKATSKVQQTSSGMSSTDSLEYYIDKIERELAQVDESLYIERMNKVIRADERLQRIVDSYILHTLDKEGRPQTAENMYNVKTEQDEE